MLSSRLSKHSKELDIKVYKALSQALLCFHEQSVAQSPIKLCVALSGGLDSTVLLHVLADIVKQQTSLNITLEAFHVNHGISQYSDKWEQFCNQLCSNLNVPFFCKKLNLSKVKQQSLEADARDARYAALVEHAGQNTLIALAQHENDQAETFLLQLKRGAGVAGLASMPAYHSFQGAYFCRPLLKVSQQELANYAKRHKLAWQEDESNKDVNFDRNFLRLNVLPILEKRWPSINKTIARSADNCAQALKVNNEYMALLCKSLLNNNDINLAALTTQSDATKISFVQYWLTQIVKVNISKAQLNTVLKICDANATESSHILFGNIAIERFQGELCFSEFNNYQLNLINQFSQSKNSNKNNQYLTLDFSSQQAFILSDKFVLTKVASEECSHILGHAIEKRDNSETYSINQTWCEANNIILIENNQCRVVLGNTSEKAKYQENRPTKRLKAWYQEWQVTPLNRLITPVIYSESGIVAICSKKLRVLSSSNVTKHSNITVLRITDA